MFISWRRLWKRNFLHQNFIFEFCNFFLWQRVEIVQTRLRATSPGPHGSRDASNNPYCHRQSAPTMQPSLVQHMQSMAAAMTELTRQNQELTRELNLRRQRYEGNIKAKKIEGMLNPKVSQEIPLHAGYHTWKKRRTKWGRLWMR